MRDDLNDAWKRINDPDDLSYWPYKELTDEEILMHTGGSDKPEHLFILFY
ncbi:MAG TPA: hypothetical protein VEL11_00435 [Candidatus Bathyarchaeia archaeon]|nr:hypothetical protein [Candidatus Bathyarchaeia archaeon]